MERNEELVRIMNIFAESGWDLIDGPSKAWLSGGGSTDKLIAAIRQADRECGSYGCEYDTLYKRALKLLVITHIEELSMRAWPAFEERRYDGWILRFAEGFTKRANSVYPLYASAIDLTEKIAYCENAYAARGLPTVFKLTPESNPLELDTQLERRGYDRLDETSVRVLSLGDKRYTARDVGLYPHVRDAWLTAYARCSRIDDADTVSKLARILGGIPGETIFAYIMDGDVTVACGLGVLDGGYLGCFDIVVDAAYRGRGHGRGIMEGLLAEGVRRGAHTAYLQVVAGNRPAESLYDGLGFKEKYRYWYRSKKLI